MCTGYGGVGTEVIPGQFANTMDEVTTPDDNVHISSNVGSMFTEIPISDTTDHHLASYGLRKLHHVNGTLAKQYILHVPRKSLTDMPKVLHGVSHLPFNIFVNAFKEEAIGTALTNPKRRQGNVDDIFAIWPHEHFTLRNFLARLSSVFSSMKLSVELETPSIALSYDLG
jgi:hypothetical protein